MCFKTFWGCACTNLVNHCRQLSELTCCTPGDNEHYSDPSWPRLTVDCLRMEDTVYVFFDPRDNTRELMRLEENSCIAPQSGPAAYVIKRFGSCKTRHCRQREPRGISRFISRYEDCVEDLTLYSYTPHHIHKNHPEFQSHINTEVSVLDTYAIPVKVRPSECRGVFRCFLKNKSKNKPRRIERRKGLEEGGRGRLITHVCLC
ncbi:hypothetical protein ElyMa_003285600 [Elysia marginata]|uniref:Uncharacterized protein n=1 Tax=Elysia marginata TaxID=1093978 RepID=A0AAV4JCV1_9GAST|nr:hypothetical protein ElyMa_003285600 [Elysia marginata]